VSVSVIVSSFLSIFAFIKKDSKGQLKGESKIERDTTKVLRRLSKEEEVE